MSQDSVRLLKIILETPLGLMPAKLSCEGVVGLEFPDPATRCGSIRLIEKKVNWFSSKYPQPSPAPQQLASTERLLLFLQQYFSGEKAFDRPALDFSGCSEFEREILQRTADIPFGQTRSYGELARAVGKPGGARAVGGVMHRNRWVLLVPCHRVVGSPNSGKRDNLGGFSSGLDLKRLLLRFETAESGRS